MGSSCLEHRNLQHSLLDHLQSGVPASRPVLICPSLKARHCLWAAERLPNDRQVTLVLNAVIFEGLLGFGNLIFKDCLAIASGNHLKPRQYYNLECLRGWYHANVVAVEQDLR